MNTTEALKIIASKSPALAADAIKAISSFATGSSVAQSRYNRIAQAAISDPGVKLSPEERTAIIDLIQIDAATAEAERRSVTLQARVTPSEYAGLETAAKDGGFRNVSDYVRDRLGLK